MSDRAEAEAKAAAERGYRVSGMKGIKLADWHLKKDLDDARFERLIASLRARKWQRDVHEEGGEKLDRLRERKNRWGKEHRDHDAKNAADRERRHRAHASRGEVFACEQCGVRWCSVPWARGRNGRGRWCSNRCRQRYHFKPSQKRTYRCGSCGEQGHTRRTCREARR